MSGTGQTRVVGPNGHLHLIEDSLIVLALFDVVDGCPLHRHVHRRVVVGCSRDQVHVGDHPVRIRLIIMDERPSGRFNATDPPGSPRFHFLPDFCGHNFRVVKETNHILGGVEKFNQPRPVIEKGILGRSAEGFPEFLKLLLSKGGGEPVTDVYPGERIRAIDSLRIIQVHGETTGLLHIGELEISPWFDMLRNVVSVLIIPEVLIRTIGRHHPQDAVIKIKGTIFLHRPQKPGLDHGESVDCVKIFWKDLLLREVNRELCKLQDLVGHRLYLIPLFGAKGFAESSRHSSDRMDGLSAEDFKHPCAELPASYSFLCDVGNFPGNTNHVTERVIYIRPHHEVRSSQEIEMEDMLFRVRNGIGKFSQLLGCRRDLNTEEGIAGLRAGQVMGPCAYTANACHDPRQFLDGSSDAKLFKTSQFYHLNLCITHMTGVIELNEDLRMAFYSCHRLNYNLLTHSALLIFSVGVVLIFPEHQCISGTWPADPG